jgi:hypothetical protein
MLQCGLFRSNFTFAISLSFLNLTVFQNHSSSNAKQLPPSGKFATSDLRRTTLERVMGIEPTQPAWKAGALPLSYTRRINSDQRFTLSRLHISSRCPPQQTTWWRGLDSNQRRHSQRVYSPSLLTTQAPLRNASFCFSSLVARSAHYLDLSRLVNFKSTQQNTSIRAPPSRPRPDGACTLIRG